MRAPTLPSRRRAAGGAAHEAECGFTREGSFLRIPFAYFRVVIIGLTAIAVLAPLSLVFYQSVLSAPFFQPAAQFTLNAYIFVFADPDFWTAFVPTVVLGAGI